MAVSEVAGHIHLDELIIGQKVKLRQIARLPLPDDESQESCISSTCWAPDSSAVLIVKTCLFGDMGCEVRQLFMHSMALISVQPPAEVKGNT